MAIADLPLLTAIHQRANWLSQRQVLIAENIANADTPGFQPRDVKVQRFQDLLLQRPAVLTLAATQPGHRGTPASLAAGVASERSRTVYETAPAGNAVILEEQLARMHETAIDHRLITQLYRKFLGLVRMAASARG